MADRGEATGKRSVGETFSRLRELGKTAFIPFITAGDPDLATTSKALKILDSCGSDVIELGVPYSDPLADGPVIQASVSYCLHLPATKSVLLTTPTTPIERMKEIAKASEGFLYLVSAVGVTGARSNVNARVEHLLQQIKQATNKPVAVGFGVSTPEHVKQIAGWGADGVIIGSAIVRQLCEAATPEEGLKRLEEYAKNIKAAMP
ncbi:hypothetical protein PR202_gb10637 [Eleusine coracana subsp. coracana]|uniref:tryptophan synthase n=1 Tax=Eleusine coracana subsp. coracana TaxID=191504 RepID=A0AAV5EKI4_ELECO|nr:hypothetical protein PR202_gb10637 [Eleusine coracana subsp. coracana]